MKQPLFKIGERVWYAVPDGGCSIITDCKYSLRHNEWTYQVSFDESQGALEYYEEELSRNKVII